ncbi:hypothetical protein N5853_11410 [Bartonella sp. HY329]|uniref:hypothetical protein n=1 Tax=unclassified Bartonella TaxID=2645622 RepID=UPI0021C7DB6D|nr:MULTISPECIES: hypothetical protein [unclassified Bartonella]UXM94695.1 hypothetical protein N5853_11410 [Bartonella sp. HY329]UXN09018.1 hypothetical protein N5852_11420 [Bartonella sp. HY328]
MDDFKLVDVKDAVLLIPYGVKIPLSLSNFTTCFYALSKSEILHEDLPENNGVCIYAPGLIGTWLSAMPHLKIPPAAKIFVDKAAIFSKLSKSLIRYHLLYEKFRLGSDVPSPFLTRLSNQQGHYNMIKNLTIGEWLQCFTAQKTDDDQIIII